MPLVVSMGILSVIGLWNDYMTPYLYLNSKPTVALGVYTIQTLAEGRSAMPQAFAAMSFMTVFVLILYASFSDSDNDIFDSRLQQNGDGFFGKRFGKRKGEQEYDDKRGVIARRLFQIQRYGFDRYIRMARAYRPHGRALAGI